MHRPTNVHRHLLVKNFVQNVLPNAIIKLVRNSLQRPENGIKIKTTPCYVRMHALGPMALRAAIARSIIIKYWCDQLLLILDKMLVRERRYSPTSVHRLKMRGAIAWGQARCVDGACALFRLKGVLKALFLR